MISKVSFFLIILMILLNERISYASYASDASDAPPPPPPPPPIFNSAPPPPGGNLPEDVGMSQDLKDIPQDYQPIVSVLENEMQKRYIEGFEKIKKEKEKEKNMPNLDEKALIEVVYDAAYALKLPPFPTGKEAGFQNKKKWAIYFDFMILLTLKRFSDRNEGDVRKGFLDLIRKTSQLINSDYKKENAFPDLFRNFTIAEKKSLGKGGSQGQKFNTPSFNAFQNIKLEKVNMDEVNKVLNSNELNFRDFFNKNTKETPLDKDFEKDKDALLDWLKKLLFPAVEVQIAEKYNFKDYFSQKGIDETIKTLESKTLENPILASLEEVADFVEKTLEGDPNARILIFVDPQVFSPQWTKASEDTKKKYGELFGKIKTKDEKQVVDHLIWGNKVAMQTISEFKEKYFQDMSSPIVSYQLDMDKSFLQKVVGNVKTLASSDYNILVLISPDLTEKGYGCLSNPYRPSSIKSGSILFNSFTNNKSLSEALEDKDFEEKFKKLFNFSVKDFKVKEGETKTFYLGRVLKMIDPDFVFSKEYIGNLFMLQRYVKEVPTRVNNPLHVIAFHVPDPKLNKVGKTFNIIKQLNNTDTERSANFILDEEQVLELDKLIADWNHKISLELEKASTQNN